MSEFKPLDTSGAITNEDLADAYNKLHSCVHQGFQGVGAKVDDLAKVVKTDRHNARNRDLEQDFKIGRIMGALGVPLPSDQDLANGHKPKRAKKKLAGMSQLQAASWAFGIAGGAAALYKYIFPAMEAGLAALHAALMAG